MNLIKKSFPILLLFLFLYIPVFGQQASQTVAVSITPETNPYAIGAGDLLEVKVVGQAEISGKYRVSEAGKIILPYVGEIQAAGLTEKALGSLLQESLLKFLRSPEVGITISEYNSQFVTIIGAVKTPGRYSLQRSLRLFDIIGMAGGMSERSGSSINLIRYPDADSKNGNEVVEVRSIELRDLFGGRPELNCQIFPGDLINVPEADTIYVTGSVQKPGSYNPKEPVTLTQALALAGGMTAEASRKQISLFRIKPGAADREELTFSLSDLEKRRVKDPFLMPNDVVYIRGSEVRSIGLAFVRALTGGAGSSLGFGIIR